MKFIPQVSAALLSLGLLTAASAEDAVKFNVPGVSTPASTPAAPAKSAPAAAAPAVKFTEAQLMEAFGYIFILQSGFAGQMEAMEFTPAARESVVRGMTLAMGGKDLPYDQAQSQQLQTQLQEFMKTKQEAYLAKREAFLTKLRMQNLNDNVAFFTKLKENKNVIELPSGLRYEILKPATGAAAKPGQVATIHYTGSLVNGQVFDSTTVNGGQPVDLPMVTATQESPNGTIAGMVEGLSKIGVGGKAKFYIPPSLAYGDSGNQGIPPGAALIFEVEVLGVKDMPKEAATPAAK
jgi:FKBP-type peptidyl-prolyl cis-trans isomerase